MSNRIVHVIQVAGLVLIVLALAGTFVFAEKIARAAGTVKLPLAIGLGLAFVGANLLIIPACFPGRDLIDAKNCLELSDEEIWADFRTMLPRRLVMVGAMNFTFVLCFIMLAKARI